MDGDKHFETIIDLRKIGVNDCCELIDISSFAYKDFVDLMQKVSDNMWSNALKALNVAEKERYKYDLVCEIKTSFIYAREISERLLVTVLFI